VGPLGGVFGGCSGEKEDRRGMRYISLFVLNVCLSASTVDKIPAPVSDHPNIKLALQYQAEGQSELAREQYEIAIREVSGEKSVTAGHIFNLAGIYYHEAGMYSQAESTLQRSLTLWQELLGSENIAIARILNRLACVFLETGQLKQAERLKLEEWEPRIAQVNPDSADHINVLGTMALLKAQRGRYDDARKLNLKALSILKARGEEKSLDTVAILNQLSLISLTTGNFEDAGDTVIRARQILQNSDEQPHVFHTVVNNGILARIYQRQKKYAEAAPLVQESLALVEKHCGSDSIRTAQLLHEYAVVLQRLNRDKEARTLSERARSIANQSGAFAFATQRIDISDLAKTKGR
jgi:tetratricopeptide (TPR) repeat protein